jgi:hypothetical protein
MGKWERREIKVTRGKRKVGDHKEDESIILQFILR